jgi:hypothetical protein
LEESEILISIDLTSKDANLKRNCLREALRDTYGRSPTLTLNDILKESAKRHHRVGELAEDPDDKERKKKVTKPSNPKDARPKVQHDTTTPEDCSSNNEEATPGTSNQSAPAGKRNTRNTKAAVSEAHLADSSTKLANAWKETTESYFNRSTEAGDMKQRF